MSTPWRSHRLYGVVLALVLLVASCHQAPRRHPAWRSTMVSTVRQSEAPKAAPIVTPGAPRQSLRGQVLSRATGQPLTVDTHLVVFALAKSEAASDGRSSTSHSAAKGPTPVARFDGEDHAPAFVVTSPGNGVRFENRDEICHGLFSSSGPNAFDLGMLNPGESKTVNFQHPGPVQVYCSLHTGKQMSLLVTPTPRYAVVNDDGSFVLENLAPGDYFLEAWDAGLPPDRRRVPDRLHVSMPSAATQPVLIHVDPEPAKRAE